MHTLHALSCSGSVLGEGVWYVVCVCSSLQVQEDVISCINSYLRQNSSCHGVQLETVCWGCSVWDTICCSYLRYTIPPKPKGILWYVAMARMISARLVVFVIFELNLE